MHTLCETPEWSIFLRGAQAERCVGRENLLAAVLLHLLKRRNMCAKYASLCCVCASIYLAASANQNASPTGGYGPGSTKSKAPC